MALRRVVDDVNGVECWGRDVEGVRGERPYTEPPPEFIGLRSTLIVPSITKPYRNRSFSFSSRRVLSKQSTTKHVCDGR